MSDISSWLDQLGLGQYAAAFVANAIDRDVLPDLTDAEFDRLGVPLGHRKQILKALCGIGVGANAVGASAHVSTNSEPEKRLLTVLFCDLVGSTALAVRLDAEDLSTVIRRFQMTCANVVTSYGGYVAKFLGDGLLAYFGYPVTREDEPESAVRAGLDLIARVGRLLLPSGEALQLRVGIATGVVVVASSTFSGSADEVAATGEPPNLAARLQEVASSNTIIVSAVTRKLLGGGFVCERLGPLKLKGFSEPIHAYKVVGETALDRIRRQDRLAADPFRRSRTRIWSAHEPVGEGEDGRGSDRAHLRRAGNWQVADQQRAARPHRKRESCRNSLAVLLAPRKQPILSGDPKSGARCAFRSRGQRRGQACEARVAAGSIWTSHACRRAADRGASLNSRRQPVSAARPYAATAEGHDHQRPHPAGAVLYSQATGALSRRGRPLDGPDNA